MRYSAARVPEQDLSMREVLMLRAGRLSIVGPSGPIGFL